MNLLSHDVLAICLREASDEGARKTGVGGGGGGVKREVMERKRELQWK